MGKLMRKLALVLLVFTCIYAILLIPDSESQPLKLDSPAQPFYWNNGQLLQKLENDFVQSKGLQPFILGAALRSKMQEADSMLAAITEDIIPVTDKRLLYLETVFFQLAPLVAAAPESLSWYLAFYTRVRNLVKKHAHNWDMNTAAARQTVYRLLYGMRAATEEAILQAGDRKIDPVLQVTDAYSATASTTLLGMKLHSGDILVSRGAAPVSALIARGNDYPANFSHIALLHVDSITGDALLIESHIEKGVAITTPEEYLKDTKLRLMVLRPSNVLPALKADPLLPQKAASMMLEAVRQRHIPYDFKMDFHDTTAMFCSEVASYAYRRQGLHLWEPVSTISSSGVVNWLQSFGVAHFVTQMPGDLEYDPQLAVVSEWRNTASLFSEHIDNAVLDAMLGYANSGAGLQYNKWKLPVARTIKAYCMVLNRFGKYGLIPEGMSATRALKNESFVNWFERVKAAVRQQTDAFMETKKYRPPYWQLVKFSEQAVKSIRQ